LLEDTVERAGGQVLAELSRHGNAARVRHVFELAMTTASTHFIPTVIVKKAEDIFDLHRATLASRLARHD